MKPEGKGAKKRRAAAAAAAASSSKKKKPAAASREPEATEPDGDASDDDDGSGRAGHDDPNDHRYKMGKRMHELAGGAEPTAREKRAIACIALEASSKRVGADDSFVKKGSGVCGIAEHDGAAGVDQGGPRV
mmetsp:Transcript_17548/g.53974  ORF Transcript_17548/g.53974 Transcript_17548/m.53974 type:complete len:132 (-) Transcript_17548:559-954(-)